MLGKASEIKTEFIDGGFVSELQRDIKLFLLSIPNGQVIDIKYQSVVDSTSDNGIYHIAMIIYKQGESS